MEAPNSGTTAPIEWLGRAPHLPIIGAVTNNDCVTALIEDYDVVAAPIAESPPDEQPAIVGHQGGHFPSNSKVISLVNVKTALEGR